MSGERTVTRWASDELASSLDGLALADGVQVDWSDAAWVSGEVTVQEYKGKPVPIYSLEAEVPWTGTVDGKQCSGTVRLPDISLEMLDDLEVTVTGSAGSEAAAASIKAAGADAVKAAIRQWNSGVRQRISDGSELPLDPPTQAQTPRAAALISDEVSSRSSNQEAMSAGGAAALDEAQEAEGEVEELAHPDDAQGEEPPFTEEEVQQLFGEVDEAIGQSFEEEEGKAQMGELQGELEGKDLQEQGRILVEVLEYMHNPGQEGEEGAEGAEAQYDVPEYGGPEQLQRLQEEVFEMCVDEDVPRLKEELAGKPAEEQWKLLFEVREYLLEGDAEEQAAFDDWQPTADDLEEEWKLLLERVPEEELAEVEADWNKGGGEDKKKMVWDVRKFIAEQDAADEEEAAAEEEARAQQQDPRAGPPAAREDGKSEVRRRGARRGDEYERNYEYGVDNEQGGGDFGEYYEKEGKGRAVAKRGRSWGLIFGVMLLLAVLTLLLTATVMAEDDEPVLQSALRLVRLN